MTFLSIFVLSGATSKQKAAIRSNLYSDFPIWFESEMRGLPSQNLLPDNSRR